MLSKLGSMLAQRHYPLARSSKWPASLGTDGVPSSRVYFDSLDTHPKTGTLLRRNSLRRDGYSHRTGLHPRECVFRFAGNLLLTMTSLAVRVGCATCACGFVRGRYDAKLWQFASIYGKAGDIIWNVAGHDATE